MVNIIVPDLKAKHGKSAFAAGERTEGNVWPAAKGGGDWGWGWGWRGPEGREFILQINIYHLNHISLLCQAFNTTPDSTVHSHTHTTHTQRLSAQQEPEFGQRSGVNVYKDGKIYKCTKITTAIQQKYVVIWAFSLLLFCFFNYLSQ